MLVNGHRVILAYLRSKKPREANRPPVEAMAERTGLSVVLWTPQDRKRIAAELLLELGRP